MNRLMFFVMLLPLASMGQCHEFSVLHTASFGMAKYTPTLNMELGALHLRSGWYTGVGLSFYNPAPVAQGKDKPGSATDVRLEPFLKVAWMNKSDGWYQQQAGAWVGLAGDKGISYRGLGFFSGEVLGGLEGYVSTGKKYGVQVVFLFAINQYFEHETFWHKRTIY